MRDAHRYIRVYDRGWRGNLMDVLGGGEEEEEGKRGKKGRGRVRVWVERVWWGGRGCVLLFSIFSLFSLSLWRADADSDNHVYLTDVEMDIHSSIILVRKHNCGRS